MNGMATMTPEMREMMMPKMGGGTAEDSMNPGMKGMATMNPMEPMNPKMMGGGCNACSGDDASLLPRV
jgi:hypothetical protein